jgi:hypothetical protein
MILVKFYQTVFVKFDQIIWRRYPTDIGNSDQQFWKTAPISLAIFINAMLPNNLEPLTNFFGT